MGIGEKYLWNQQFCPLHTSCRFARWLTGVESSNNKLLLHKVVFIFSVFPLILVYLSCDLLDTFTASGVYWNKAKVSFFGQAGHILLVERVTSTQIYDNNYTMVWQFLVSWLFMFVWSSVSKLSRRWRAGPHNAWLRLEGVTITRYSALIHRDVYLQRSIIGV